MDEATASVDTETDGMIQNTVKTCFASRTVLTIAHRLDTVLECDRVLVMDQGKVVEMDSPKNLLENPNGAFFKLAQQAKIV